MSPWLALDKDEETLIEQADDQYNRAITSLELLGFNNIELRRTNDLKLFSFKDEGEIKSISIDGKHGFKKGDVFQYDVPIVIVVYTSEDGLPEITKPE